MATMPDWANLPWEQLKSWQRSELALRALDSTQCVCGAAKESRRSHCRSCYFRLPEPMRKALWKHITCGYEEAWHAAVVWLAQHPRKEQRHGA